MSPRRDTAAVETIEMRRWLADTGGVLAGFLKLGNSRFDMNSRPIAGISEILVTFIFPRKNKNQAIRLRDVIGKGKSNFLILKLSSSESC